MFNTTVAIAIDPAADYPAAPPFHPDTAYPEYPWPSSLSASANPAYRLVRQSLRLLGLDAAHFDTPTWNPLGHLIRSGDTVVLKPNFVLDTHGLGGDHLSVVTHPAVIRAVMDYAAIALQGQGTLIVADAPQADADFALLTERLSLDSLRDWYLGHGSLKVEIRDLRRYRYHVDWGTKRLTGRPYVTSAGRETLTGDPAGYTIVDLGARSEFRDFSGFEHLFGADYDRSVTSGAHTATKNEYSVANTILRADVVISIPKLKTHKKVGVTLNFKNLVGINTDKNYLPHFRVGPPSAGGDEFPDSVDRLSKVVMIGRRVAQDALLTRDSRILEGAYGAVLRGYKRMRKVAKVTVDQSIAFGNWYGNDTAWRMAVDLGRILLFVDRHGQLTDSPQRKYFSFVDGIRGGEGNGPLSPDTVMAGVVAAGEHPLAVDLACTRLMGFDFRRIPQFAALLDPTRGRDALGSLFIADLQSVMIRSDDDTLGGSLAASPVRHLCFKPQHGWIGHIEYT